MDQVTDDSVVFVPIDNEIDVTSTQRETTEAHPSEVESNATCRVSSGTTLSDLSSNAGEAGTSQSQSQQPPSRTAGAMHMSRHSDFTLPTSNIFLGSLPNSIASSFDDKHSASLVPRRNIFGSTVQQQYGRNHVSDGMGSSGFGPPAAGSQYSTTAAAANPALTLTTMLPAYLTTGNPYSARSAATLAAENHRLLPDGFSGQNTDHEQTISSQSYPLSLESAYQITAHHHHDYDRNDSLMSSLTLPDSLHCRNGISFSAATQLPIAPSPLLEHERIKHHSHRVHETLHAQSLLLGLAFCMVWSASNLMAPNLTEMALFYDFDHVQRDLYLGSYCALATGVLSFPIGAGIGILADVVSSRQRLFVATVTGAGLSSIATAFYTDAYWQLFLCRLINGGFMSGSVPVVFSFLGDLFATEERNTASSGLTAMMGLGIILGQVYAGMIGGGILSGTVLDVNEAETEAHTAWQHAFVVSGILTLISAVLCGCLVQEPVRGGKEKVLQDMLQAGTRYERKLTWQGFWHAMRHNQSNLILLWQGFFSSLPWGIIFVFLNDYLSQERGFSVPEATYLVLLFGLGCAAGGILGGYWGQKVQSYRRSYLPLFMAGTTAAGILPFVGLLNTHFTNAHGVYGFVFSFGGGLVASLPAVNVRPCLINVNPPETRGASLTAANLLINLGRGFGPSCITLMGSIFNVDRQYAFNVTLIAFWLISALQLSLLARTLPNDQDAMEAELASYAQKAIREQQGQHESPAWDDTDGSDRDEKEEDDDNDGAGDAPNLVSLEERMTSWDGKAARETLEYVRRGVREFREEVMSGGSKALLGPFGCADGISSEDEEEEVTTPRTMLRKREQWKRAQVIRNQIAMDGGTSDAPAYPTERTPLVV